MKRLPPPPGFATGQTSPQGGSEGAALGRPKKPRPAVMRWICPRRSGQSRQETLQNHRERKKANEGPGVFSADASFTPSPLTWNCKTADSKSPSPTDLKLGLLAFILTTAVSRRQHHCAAAMPRSQRLLAMACQNSSGSKN